MGEYSIPDKLSEAVKQATGKEIRITRAGTKEADYAFNAFALQESKDCDIHAIMDEACKKIVAVLPPGITISQKSTFLNFEISNTLLARTASNIAAEPSGGITPGGKRIMVEYCSPNTNKPLHLGHARNISIGLSLTAVLKFLGNEVVTANVTNDKGVHICKSMLAYRMFGDGRTPESEGIKGDHFVGHFYVQYEKALQEELKSIIARLKNDPANAKCSDDELKDLAKKESALEDQVNEMLKKWENGEPEIRALWQQMNAWVYEGFGETLKRLRVSFDANYFESDIYKMGAEIVQEGLRKGILDMDKSGAIIADLEKLGIKKEGKKVLLRPNGTTVYMTQDLALAKLKAEQHNLDRSMYVVADEQNDHFKTLFGILHALGFTWAEPGNLVHASYGMVNLPHGRMKSREGTVVDIDDLLDELKKGAKEKGKDINDIRADIIGKAALQFYLLSAKAETSLKYNPEDSLNFEGKTGPYILYQYVRSGKLLKKSEEKEPDFSVLTDEIEHQLLMKLVEFSDMIRILKRNPGSITVADYVYDLAKTFSLFYEKCPVLNAESEELKIARLCLTGYTHTLLGTCLDLLGIEKLESM